jgi:hypothetical protein
MWPYGVNIAIMTIITMMTKWCVRVRGLNSLVIYFSVKTHHIWEGNIIPRSLGSSLPLIFCIHVRLGPIQWGGVIYLAKKIIRWLHFTFKMPENIICDGILHVNMFYYFKIPYFTCTFFTKFNYNEYIGPYFLLHVILRFSPVNSPSQGGRFTLRASILVGFGI